MRTQTYKREGGTTWLVDVDVHEVPELAKLPVADRNRKLWDTLHNGFVQGVDTEMGDAKFYLDDLPNLEAVRKRFDTGWKEGGDRALKLADGLIDAVSQPLSIRRRVRWSDDGDEFDKERLVGGHLDTCWRTTSRQVAVATPIINIACAWGGNAHRSHEQLFWSGASAIALIRILENAGYQTSLTAVCTNDLHSREKAMVVACRVKQAGEYLRPDAIASTICAGSTYRTYVFLGWAAGPYQIPSGLGHHCAIEHLLPHAIEGGAIDAPQIVLPDAFDEQSARRSLNGALAELQAANLAAIDLRGLDDAGGYA